MLRWLHTESPHNPRSRPTCCNPLALVFVTGVGSTSQHAAARRSPCRSVLKPMPAGELLIEKAAKTLSVTDAKTVSQVHGELEGPVSRRAVRYALADLVKSGRAKRIGRRNQHFRVKAVAEKTHVMR